MSRQLFVRNRLVVGRGSIAPIEHLVTYYNKELAVVTNAEKNGRCPALSPLTRLAPTEQNLSPRSGEFPFSSSTKALVEASM